MDENLVAPAIKTIIGKRKTIRGEPAERKFGGARNALGALGDAALSRKGARS